MLSSIPQRDSNYPHLMWTELEGSPTLEFSEQNGFNAARKFKVHAKILLAFCRALKGSPSYEIGPDPFPVIDTIRLDRIMAMNVTATPFRGSRGDPAKARPDGEPLLTNLMTSEWWEVTARYDLPIKVDYTFAGELLTVPTDGLAFQDLTPINNLVSVGKVIPQLELTIRRNGLAALKPKLIVEALGAVNNSDFNPLQFENEWRARIGLGNSLPPQILQDTIHARGTVLLNAVRATMVTEPFGALTWNAEFHFLIRPNYAPWNRVFNVSAATEGSSEAQTWQTIHKFFPSPPEGGPPALGPQIELYREKDLGVLVRQ